MFSLDQWLTMLTQEQLITIFVPAGSAAFATWLTHHYQRVRFNKEKELDKLRRKSEWVLSRGRIYNAISGKCRVLRQQLELKTKKTLPIFYYSLHFVQLVKEITDEICIWYFDDLEGEAFAEFMTSKTYDKITEAFGKDLVAISRYRELIPKNGSLAQLETILGNDSSANTLYETFDRWIADKKNADSLSELVFVVANILEYQMNKMLLITYKNEGKVKEALKDRFNPTLLPMKGLPEAIERFNESFKKEIGLSFAMYKDRKLII